MFSSEKIMEHEIFVKNFQKEKSAKKNSSVKGRKGQHKKRMDIYEKMNKEVNFRDYNEKSLRYFCYVNSKLLKKLSHRSRRKNWKQELIKKIRSDELDALNVDPKPFGNTGNSGWWD